MSERVQGAPLSLREIKSESSTLKLHSLGFPGGPELRMCLPMQGTQVQSLVRKIPQATGQLSQSATTMEPVGSRAHELRSPCSVTMREAHAPQLQ